MTHAHPSNPQCDQGSFPKQHRDGGLLKKMPKRKGHTVKKPGRTMGFLDPWGHLEIWSKKEGRRKGWKEGGSEGMGKKGDIVQI